MAALELPVMAAVVALNVPEMAEAAIVTAVGTVSAELLFDRTMLAPPTGAACERLTVQVLDAFGPMLVGLQVSEETNTDVIRLMVAFAELPLYVAVIVALEFAPMAPAVAVNIAEVAEAATAADAGTVSAEFVFDKATLMPPLGAACVRTTVQVLEELELIAAGVQESEETDRGPTRVTVLVAELSR
jgi:hypothetical protein